MSDVEEEAETALFSKQFKGRCHKCGKWGHKSTDCKENKGGERNSGGGNNRGGQRTSKKCTHCGKTGHTIETCWKKQREDKAFHAGHDQDLVLFAGDFAKCSLKRKVEDMDWEEVNVIKKVKVWSTSSWGKYKAKKASEGWGDKAMMPGKGNNSLLWKVNGWDLIP